MNEIYGWCSQRRKGKTLSFFSVIAQGWFRDCTLFFNGEVTVASQPSRFIPSVPAKNVATSIRLKIPRRNKHYVSDTNPHSSLQLSPDSTQTLMPILTLHHHPVKTKQFYSYTQHVSANRQRNMPKIRFTENLSLTQISSYLCPKETVLIKADSIRKTIFFCGLVSERAAEPN